MCSNYQQPTNQLNIQWAKNTQISLKLLIMSVYLFTNLHENSLTNLEPLELLLALCRGLRSGRMAVP